MKPTCLLLSVWFLLCIPGWLHLVRAQNLTGATTDPDEAEALNSIFAAWKILRLREWNTSSELCSGPAIDDTIKIDDEAYNPFIKCDCTFNSSTICRITALKVFGKDAVGTIPPQLYTLKYLENLNLAQNYLTGSISPAIGNLTRMEWLTFGINALSGPFPKEIGLLKNLKSLGFGVNKFSGSIPPEIGNCTKLMKIYLGNFELKGGLPLSFANLVELQDLWIVDLDVTGRIPDFIGSWTKLLIMRIHGTGWSGPIPSSFSNLTSLKELYVLPRCQKSLLFISLPIFSPHNRIQNSFHSSQLIHVPRTANSMADRLARSARQQSSFVVHMDAELPVWCAESI